MVVGFWFGGMVAFSRNVYEETNFYELPILNKRTFGNNAFQMLSALFMCVLRSQLK